jgi:hypothetical protein
MARHGPEKPLDLIDGTVDVLRFPQFLHMLVLPWMSPVMRLRGPYPLDCASGPVRGFARCWPRLRS